MKLISSVVSYDFFVVVKTSFILNLLQYFIYDIFLCSFYLIIFQISNKVLFKVKPVYYSIIGQGIYKGFQLLIAFLPSFCLLKIKYLCEWFYRYWNPFSTGRTDG